MVYRRLLAWRVWLRTWLRGRDADRELDAELRSWLEEMTARRAAAGLPHDEARRAALRDAGSLVRLKEACRDSWRTTLRDEWVRNVRHGARTLRRTPAFSAVAVLTLAVGIGATTAIVGQVNAVSSRRCPSRAPTPCG